MAAFNSTAAVVLHSLVAIDAEVGMRAPEIGQLIQSADYKPERNIIMHTGHRNQEQVWIGNMPTMTIDVTSKVTLLNSGMNANAHPGKAFALSAFANWYSGVKAGFNDAGAYFIQMAPTLNAPKGDLYEIKYTLKLWFTPDDSANLVTAP